MAIIAFDVDSTILDPILSDNGWLHYLNNMAHNKLDLKKVKSMDSIPHDLNDLYPEFTHDEAFSFWSDSNLYQKLKPYNDAVAVINKLADKSHKIVFVSFCKKGHYASKCQALKDWFNIPEGLWAFCSTREKWAVNADVIIDDRHTYINMFADRPEVIKIKYATPYTQDEELKCSIDLETSDWYAIGQYLEDIL